MKSRWTTCLLLAVVVAVWGVVAWKIFATADNTPPAARPKPSETAAETAAADTLQLDYADPFLKGAPRSAAAVRPVVRGLPPVKQATPKRERVKIVHLGTVTSAGRSLYILTVGDEQYELSRGESAGDFVFADCDRDSLYLRKEGVMYGVKRCEP
ncbi:hypothetical protein [Alistipes sp.]|uniref:hypothetical protein n=1 Tax=Alistipes sp. TaxID=1872444 RepID=UPI003AB70B29